MAPEAAGVEREGNSVGEQQLPDLELVGTPSRLRSDFINGIKAAPVRYTPSARRG